MPNRSGKELSLAKNAGYGSIKNKRLKFENNSSSICKPCQNKSHDNLDNAWVEFPFDDDFFGDKEIASFDEKINNDAYKTYPVADWKAFNKRGLHLIHLNINSPLSKIDELREIARKTRATVMQLSISSKTIPPPGQTPGTRLEGGKNPPPGTIIVYKNPPPGTKRGVKNPTPGT